MNYDELKESVRLALISAIEARRGGEIATAIGVPRSTIHTLARQNVGKPNTVYQVASWLSSHGYLQGYAAPIPEKPPDPLHILATDLRALADVMDPEYPKDFKASKFAAWVKLAYENLTNLLNTISKT